MFYFLVPFLPLYLLSKRIGRSTGKQKTEPLILLLGFYGIIISEFLFFSASPVYSYEGGSRLWSETLAAIPIIIGSACIYYFVVTIDKTLYPEATFNSENISMAIIAAISILYPANIAVGESSIWFADLFSWYIPVILIALSYARISFILRRMRINLWYLAYVGAVVMISALFFCSVFSEPRFGWLEDALYNGDISLFFGAIIASIPSFELLKRMGEPLPTPESPGPQVIGDVARRASEIIGGACYPIINGAVEGYNTRFGKHVTLGSDLSIEGLEENEQEQFLEHVVEVFYQCIGPLTFDILKGVDGAEKYADILRQRHGG
jgi:hypothetical protein